MQGYAQNNNSNMPWSPKHNPGLGGMLAIVRTLCASFVFPKTSKMYHRSLILVWWCWKLRFYILSRFIKCIVINTFMLSAMIAIALCQQFITFTVNKCTHQRVPSFSDKSLSAAWQDPKTLKTTVFLYLSSFFSLRTRSITVSSEQYCPRSTGRSLRYR